MLREQFAGAAATWRKTTFDRHHPAIRQVTTSIGPISQSGIMVLGVTLLSRSAVPTAGETNCRDPQIAPSQHLGRHLAEG